MPRFQLLFLIIIIIVFFSMLSVDEVQSYKKRSKTTSKPPPQKPSLPVIPHSAITIQSVLAHHDKPDPNTQNLKIFGGDTLAYVTPWNTKGYEIAKRFTQKFTYISPVWYQIDCDTKLKKFELRGKHNVDQSWITQLRKNNVEKPPKIVPRFVVENWSQAQYNVLFKLDTNLDNEQSYLLDFAYLITDELVNEGYDGAVLELGPLIDSSASHWQIVSTLIIAVGSVFQSYEKELILVIPPVRSKDLFGATDLAILSAYVSKFSLMTYDFSNRPGPVAPIEWVVACVMHLLSPDSRGVFNNKVLLGLNFYGYDFTGSLTGGKPIVNHEFLSLLKQYGKGNDLVWEERFLEHRMRYTAKDGTTHHIFYPTLASISERVKQAQELGVGIAIWEIGQGLDYFYDLL